MSIENIARNYFKSFENMNIDELSEMFGEHISLKDWNIEAHGKQLVLEANQNIFNSVNTLNVLVDNLYISGQTAIAQLSICVDGEPPLPVVDIIHFDESNRINSIIAYRGN